MPGADRVTIKRLGEPGEGSYRVLVNGRLLGYVTRGVGGRWDGRDLVTGHRVAHLHTRADVVDALLAARARGDAMRRRRG